MSWGEQQKYRPGYLHVLHRGLLAGLAGYLPCLYVFLRLATDTFLVLSFIVLLSSIASCSFHRRCLPSVVSPGRYATHFSSVSLVRPQMRSTVVASYPFSRTGKIRRSTCLMNNTAALESPASCKLRLTDQRTGDAIHSAKALAGL